MSEWLKVKAADGHELSVYVVRPEQEPIGALVLVQEIFGVNAHIRSVADGYAKDGFVVVAPALFERLVTRVRDQGLQRMAVLRALAVHQFEFVRVPDDAFGERETEREVLEVQRRGHPHRVRSAVVQQRDRRLLDHFVAEGLAARAVQPPGLRGLQTVLLRLRFHRGDCAMRG